ncbi:hypothetical protein HPG69_004078, partial [Diceros bicornis minor]
VRERSVKTVELRLKNGGHHCEGRVEVKHQGIWGTVHGYKWTLENAAVLCRQLDCGDAVGAPRGAHFGSGVGPIWLAYLFCKGTESTLNDCRHSDFKNYRNYGYYHKWDAGVVCSGDSQQELPWSHSQNNHENTGSQPLEYTRMKTSHTVIPRALDVQESIRTCLTLDIKGSRPSYHWVFRSL